MDTPYTDKKKASLESLLGPHFVIIALLRTYLTVYLFCTTSLPISDSVPTPHLS
jgi:hypothetical protein